MGVVNQMDRLTGIDQEALEIMRAQQVADAATQDTDLPPEERRDRPEVITGSILKRDDDIIWCGLPLRVVGPARDADYLIGRYDPWFGEMAFPVSWQEISDRAPADPNDTSTVPIFPVEEELQARTLMAASKKVKGSDLDERARERRLRKLVQSLPKKDAKKVERILIKKGLLRRENIWERIIRWFQEVFV